MDVKRFLVTVPIALLLTFASVALGPDPQPSVSFQVAGIIDSSSAQASTDSIKSVETPEPEPTATLEPTATPFPLPTPTLVFTPTPARINRTLRVPILMYHYVSVPPPDADIYRLDLSVTPANFRAQMQHLAASGYTPVRLSDLSDYLREGKPLPKNPVVLTFDDGYVDNYENAFPILKQFKFPATFFVITQFVDDKKPGYMTWDQLEEMAIEGMEIGAHTMTHLDLKGKSRAIQATEIAGSKAMIEARIGTPVKSFCYPAGKYDARSIDLLRSIGYHAAVTTEQGVLHSTNSIFELRRIRIRGSFSVNDFSYWLKYFMAGGK